MHSIITHVGPQHLPTVLWLQECGILDTGCDMLATDHMEKYLEWLHASRRFGTIFQNRPYFSGLDYKGRMQRVMRLLEGQNRHYRKKLSYFRFFKPRYSLPGAADDYDRYVFADPELSPEYLWCYDDQLHGRPVSIAAWEHSVGTYMHAPFSDDWTRSGGFGLLTDVHRLPFARTRTVESWAFKPEIALIPGPNVIARGIPPIDRGNAAYTHMVNDLFGVTAADLAEASECDYILMDVYIGDSPRAEADAIERIAGNGRLGVKRHPGTNPDAYAGLRIMKGGDIPWEVYVLGLPDIGDKVLLTTVSTAVLTPKLRFDDEPYLIFLNRIYGMEFPMAEKIGALYRAPERIFIPANIGELEGAVRKIEASRKNGRLGDARNSG